MSRSRIALGKIGEDLACLELQRRGYAILARRYRRRMGGLDILARGGPPVVFIEVKPREGRQFGDAVDGVTGLKRRRMTRVALEYLVRHRLTDCPCRFDVVSVHMENEQPVIELYQNAFSANG